MMQVRDLLMVLNKLTHTQAADKDLLHSRTPIRQKQMKNKLIFTDFHSYTHSNVALQSDMREKY